MKGLYWNKQGKYQKEMNSLFEELVPAAGSGGNVASELLRAGNKLYYRAFNDGDIEFPDYTGYKYLEDTSKKYNLISIKQNDNENNNEYIENKNKLEKTISLVYYDLTLTNFNLKNNILEIESI